MSGVNKSIFIGHVGGDVEIKEFSGGKLARFSIATSEKYKDRTGQQQEVTDWHSLEAWGKLADICEKYVQKGKQIYVECKHKTDTYQDQAGQTKRREYFKVMSLQLL